MNFRRFNARSSREALAMVREQLGDDAVVLSNRSTGQGVEVLAMPAEGLQAIEAVAQRPAAATSTAGAGGSSLATALAARRAAAAGADEPLAPARSAATRGGAMAAPDGRIEPRLGTAGAGIVLEDDRREPRGDLPPSGPSAASTSVEQDVQTLGMSTLSFQDYVRERMLRRRQAELQAQQTQAPPAGQTLADRLAQRHQPAPVAAASAHPQSHPNSHPNSLAQSHSAASRPAELGALIEAARQGAPVAPRAEPPVLGASAAMMASPPAVPTLSQTMATAAAPVAVGPRDDMMDELRSVRSLIEERFGMLAFMDRLHKHPAHVQLSQRLLEAGLSPGLVRRLVQALPDDAGDPLGWAAQVLAHNVRSDDALPRVEDSRGIVALVGPTGVGKTTTCAKIAAAFAARHGAGNLGLITLDAYRLGAHEQLRAYGRILGVAVHSAQDRASLEDLLDLLAPKQLVLVDTAGMAQRDARTAELLQMLAQRSIRRLLVLNAAAQGETLDDVMQSYDAAHADGVIVSKIDEAVKLGPVIDTLIRHRAVLRGVTNGQRVPEDWHHLAPAALVDRALSGEVAPSWRVEADDVSLTLAAPAPRGAWMAPATAARAPLAL